MDLLRRNATRSGRQWSAAASSPFFDYVAADGSRHQVWYEDGESLSLKYEVAVGHGLRGVGFWPADIGSVVGGGGVGVGTGAQDRASPTLWG